MSRSGSRMHFHRRGKMSKFMKFSMGKRRASALLVAFLFVASFLPLIAVTSEPVRAQTDEIVVNWHLIRDGIIHKVWEIDVKNLAGTDRLVSLDAYPTRVPIGGEVSLSIIVARAKGWGIEDVVVTYGARLGDNVLFMRTFTTAITTKTFDRPISTVGFPAGDYTAFVEIEWRTGEAESVAPFRVVEPTWEFLGDNWMWIALVVGILTLVVLGDRRFWRTDGQRRLR